MNTAYEKESTVSYSDWQSKTNGNPPVAMMYYQPNTREYEEVMTDFGARSNQTYMINNSQYIDTVGQSKPSAVHVRMAMQSDDGGQYIHM